MCKYYVGPLPLKSSINKTFLKICMFSIKKNLIFIDKNTMTMINFQLITQPFECFKVICLIKFKKKLNNYVLYTLMAK